MTNVKITSVNSDWQEVFEFDSVSSITLDNIKQKICDSNNRYINKFINIIMRQHFILTEDDFKAEMVQCLSYKFIYNFVITNCSKYKTCY